MKRERRCAISQGQRALDPASDVAAMNALYASAFGPAPYPARTTCVVQALPGPKDADRDRIAWRRWRGGDRMAH